MTSTSSGRRFVRRLLVGAGVACALSLAWSGAALAQSSGLVGLGSSSGSNPAAAVVNGVTETAAPVTQAAAPVVQNVATPVAQVTAPAAQTAAPVVQAAAPVVQATTPVVQAAAPVVQAAAPVLRAAAPVTDAAAPILEAAAPVTEPVTEGVAGNHLRQLSGDDQGTAGASRRSSETPSSTTTPSAPAASESTPISAVVPPTATVFPVERNTAQRTPLGPDRVARDAKRSVGLGAPVELPTSLPSPELTSSVAPPGVEAPKGANARAPSAPGPSAPGTPSVPSSAAAVFSGSGASIFVAALVAALLLAVPGLSRRLRLALAPWPLPISLPSLERPG